MPATIVRKGKRRDGIPRSLKRRRARQWPRVSLIFLFFPFFSCVLGIIEMPGVDEALMRRTADGPPRPMAKYLSFSHEENQGSDSECTPTGFTWLREAFSFSALTSVLLNKT